MELEWFVHGSSLSFLLLVCSSKEKGRDRPGALETEILEIKDNVSYIFGDPFTTSVFRV